MKAYKSIHNFKRKSSLFTWLYSIAKNESYTFLKKNSKYTYSNLEELSATQISNLEADPYFDGTQAKLELQKHLLKLPPRQLEVFRMRYYNDMKFKDISEAIGCTVSNAKTNYHLAKKKIERNFLLY